MTYLTSSPFLPQISSKSPLNSASKDIILYLAYYCRYITVEALIVYLDESESHVSLYKKQIRKYISKGLLEAIRFKEEDMFSRSAYCLTKTGHFYVSLMIDTNDALHIPYKKRNSEITLMHDYSTGLNYMSLAASPYVNAALPFKTEVMLSHSDKSKKDALCADAYTNIFGSNVFIEEDLGNEPNSTLISKFERYVAFSLLGNHSKLILSCRQPYKTITSKSGSPYSSCFDINEIKKLLVYMRMQDKTLEDLASDNYMAPSVSTSCISSLCALVLSCHKKLDTFDYNCINRFYLDLETRKNPYRLQEYVKSQTRFASRKKNALFRIYMDKIKKGDYSLSLQKMLLGQSIYILPTVLLGNHLCEVFPDKTSLLHRASALVSAFYKEPLSFSEGTYELSPGIYLKNRASSTYGGVYLEFYSCDLGAMIRCAHFAADTKLNAHLIIYVHSIEEAVSFSSTYLPTNHANTAHRSITYILWQDTPFLFSASSDADSIKILQKDA